MAASEVGIINYALNKIGEDPIISRSDDTKAARVADLRFDAVRDAVLRAHPWNCAVKRASLAKLASDPPFGFDHQFQLPSDCLRVLRFEDPNMVYRIEGRKILTDNSAGDVNLIYIARVTDPNLFDALFIEALAERLAADFAIPISQDKELEQARLNTYQLYLQEARSIDGQEEPPQELRAEEWLDARLGTVEPFRPIEDS